MWAIFKVFIKLVTVLLLFYVLLLWPWGIGILAFWSGTEPTPCALEGRVLSTEPPEVLISIAIERFPPKLWWIVQEVKEPLPYFCILTTSLSSPSLPPGPALCLSILLLQEKVRDGCAHRLGQLVYWNRDKEQGATDLYNSLVFSPFGISLSPGWEL